MTTQVHCPRLIEVALPIRELSAESVRDNSLRHGNIRTLHVWWARRPLAACRALVFASLVPDPDHPSCPPDFRAAVAKHLQTQVPSLLRSYRRGRNVINDSDPYRPYEGVADTLRNRLLTFLAKWSPEALAFENGKTSETPDPTCLLDDRSLCKWETSDPTNPQGKEVLRVARELINTAGFGHQPAVLDPFSGGGAIPLEAGRLGCTPYANDYNPVAHLVLRASCEFPQTFGKPGERMVEEETFGSVKQHKRRVDNVLSHDVETLTRGVLARLQEQLGDLYPVGKDKRPVLAYLWARTVACRNPTCRGQIPLLRTLLVCNKKGKRAAVTMSVDKTAKRIAWGIARDPAIRVTDGPKQERGPAICPFCEQPTKEAEIRESSRAGQLGQSLIAVIVDGHNGRDYRPPEQLDIDAFTKASARKPERPSEPLLPEVTTVQDEEDAETNSTGIRVHLYGFKTWGSLFNERQLLVIQTVTRLIQDAVLEVLKAGHSADYARALAAYLGIWVSRNTMRMTTIGRWHVGRETLETPFDGPKMPMKLDYPEANPFSEASGGFANQIDWISKYIEHESGTGIPARVSLGDSASLAIPTGTVSAVVTDPPYFDEAAYADLSDFFYIWLKRILSNEFPQVFATPLTPKSQEATALRHRHQSSAEAADKHFTGKLAAIFKEARRVMRPDGVLSVIFAHQGSDAWAALVHSLFEAGLSIDATWPIEMEMANRTRALNSSALQTSITVICRPRTVGDAASFKDLKKEVHSVVKESIQRFWSYGFRGADLVVSCYGPAVGVFGRYSRVEKADGTPVLVPELLDIARAAARDAIAGEFRGDDLSTLYYVWATLYGASEQAWDDARLVVQIGGNAENAMEVARSQGIFVVDGSTCRLALLADRQEQRGLGADQSPPLIDALHRGMLLWKTEKRRELVQYLQERGLFEFEPFWKLAQALFEVLPRDSEDWKLVNTLLSERATLRSEGMKTTAQTQLFGSSR